MAKTKRQTAPTIRLGAKDILWDYARLARLYGLELIGVAIALLVVSAILEATSEDGWSWSWLGVVVGIAGITGLIFFPLLSVWLRRGGLPSIRLPDAQASQGSRILAAAPSDWRRWTVATSALLFIACAAMLVFLVAVLGRGGTAEGVVIGVLMAWGYVTVADGLLIETTQSQEKRAYWAVGRRPTGAGNRLLFTAAKD
ncbi:MAG: hypothetical protein EXQ74_03040 [Thermoleophilia bacterium]|nr:hypothetical protein [Thermoleophilia bacterium]